MKSDTLSPNPHSSNFTLNNSTDLTNQYTYSTQGDVKCSTNIQPLVEWLSSNQPIPLQTGKFSDDNDLNKRALASLSNNLAIFQAKMLAQSTDRKLVNKAQLITKKKKLLFKRIQLRSERNIRAHKLKVQISLPKREKGSNETHDKCFDILTDMISDTIPIQVDYLKDSLLNRNRTCEALLNTINQVGLSSKGNENISSDYLKEVKNLMEGYKEVKEFQNRV